MFLSLAFKVFTASLEVVVNDRVGTLAVKADFAVAAQDHRHSLAHVVEIKDAQQFVDLRLAHHLRSVEKEMAVEYSPMIGLLYS